MPEGYSAVDWWRHGNAVAASGLIGARTSACAAAIDLGCGRGQVGWVREGGGATGEANGVRRACVCVHA